MHLRLHNGRWTPCAQESGCTSLEQCAFEWQPEFCEINCLPPWLSMRSHSSTAEDTCVLEMECIFALFVRT